MIGALPKPVTVKFSRNNDQNGKIGSVKVKSSSSSSSSVTLSEEEKVSWIFFLLFSHDFYSPFLSLLSSPVFTSTLLYSTLLYTTLHYSTLLYSTLLYSIKVILCWSYLLFITKPPASRIRWASSDLEGLWSTDIAMGTKFLCKCIKSIHR